MATMVEDKRKEIVKVMMKRKQLEDKAYQIVINLVDGAVTEEALSDIAQHITHDHYSDIVEERSIEKNCGYPVCKNKIKNVPKQIYKLSGSAVYDLTKRKCFCSDACFTASEHFQKQISVEPLWLRPSDQRVSYNFLSRDQISGRPGDLVCDSSKSELLEDIKKLERDELSDEIIAQAAKLSNIKIHVVDDVNCEGNTQILVSDPSKHEIIDTKEEINSQTKVTKRVLNEVNKVPRQMNELSVLEGLRSTLVEWVTVNTVVYVKVSQLPEHSRGEKLGASTQETGSAEQKRTEQIVLPHVDSQSPMIVRRKIVFDKLDRVLPDLLRHSLYNAADLRSDLKLLLETFELSNSNILLKPKEWMVMGVLILNIIALRSQALYDALREEAFDIHIRYIINCKTSAMELADIVRDVISTKSLSA